MKETTFFIVGTPKAGTTSLYHYLEEHPEIYLSPIKETNYFSYEAIKAQNLYYKEEHISTIEEYQEQFKNSVAEKAIGEASVSYLFYPEVPEKIKSYNANANIIIILRNPVDRGFSHFLMDSRLGLVGDLSFEDIIYKKKKHPNIHLYYQQFIELGCYYNQVKRYLDTFGTEKVKIFLLEDLKENLSLVIHEIFEFLQVDTAYFPNLEVSHNTFLNPKNKVIGNFYKQKWIRSLLKSVLPEENIHKIKQLLFSKDSKPKMDKVTQEYLRNYYKNDCIKLEQLIQRNLSSWYGN